MVFSSTFFLFFFLPALLVFYGAARSLRLRNAVLLVASLAFYAWGELGYVFLLLGSIGANYGFGLWIAGAVERGAARRALVVAVATNLGLLGVVKYTHMFVGWAGVALGALGVAQVDPMPPLHLPLGISFFTFQALSYVIDVYRGVVPAQRSPWKLALYVSLFPQLIAGPIVRYADLAAELDARSVTTADVAAGARRFVVGLGKKVLIANALSVPADRIFALPAEQLGLEVAWLGIACYTLQIYFDFSGYSDMAIGLGRMFGFHFLENFDYPYVSRSIREFWRRWHISLSTWFRDYLYIPLGGNQGSATRTYVNLVLVFALCGLWHGASLTFVAWGLFHGVFLVGERLAAGKVRAPRLLQHLYVLVAVMVGWVLFRAESFAHA
ncbi:MAG: MBOAT family protein, partial [Planctomycetes bacterium]|nr:MBOAT family protein [Planctomycetota bacterium]